ncbi:MAG: DUF3179 domain-containing protein [Xanthomonadales bacterium]|nr:DUF3179 domain-containing protein [Xanthomonadales bacterium]
MQYWKTRFVQPVFLALLTFSVTASTPDEIKNGFRLTNALVPAEQIFSGSPVRDGIPAIDNPRFVSASDAGFLDPDDRVLGITYNGISKAYPVAILNYHEVVNDRFNGEPILVTFCPLCRTGIAYLATVDGKRLEFGVSGLLYNSDMLFYDRQTESLWSQIRRQAVSGPLKGVSLQPVILTHTRWQDWKQHNPGTLVLSTDTGFQRDYSSSPYAGYGATRELWFPVLAEDDRYHPKAPVLGLELAGRFKAYPFSELERAGGVVHDTFTGRQIVVRYDAINKKADVADENGHSLPGVTAYWFAWYAFHPETAVFTAEKEKIK